MTQAQGARALGERITLKGVWGELLQQEGTRREE